MSTTIKISGFIRQPRRGAADSLYRGRFVCPNVQWIGAGADAFATFTITAQELFDASQSQLLWTDQEVQRGIEPAATPKPPRELCLCDGYPEPSKYIFDSTKADEIADKLLSGEKLFLDPLVWNLRPGTFKAYWDDGGNAIYLYEGRMYLPDSHHRQQAIRKAVQLANDSPRDYPRFSPTREFKMELYFLTREDEGNYFFDKNQRPKPTAKSKAYDLTTQDDLSLLAKRVIDKSSSLSENVNRVTDKLTQRNPQVITLSTLREMMKNFAPADHFDSSELEGMAVIAAQMYDMLAEVRPELGVVSLADRRAIRERSLVDSAVMMHGYAALLKDFNEELATLGGNKGRAAWKTKLQKFAANKVYTFERWSGDLFDKSNPLWREIGVVKPGKDGKKLTVLNTGGARSECGRVLRQLIGVPAATKSLRFLAKR